MYNGLALVPVGFTQNEKSFQLAVVSTSERLFKLHCSVVGEHSVDKHADPCWLHSAMHAEQDTTTCSAPKPFTEPDPLMSPVTAVYPPMH